MVPTANRDRLKINLNKNEFILTVGNEIFVTIRLIFSLNGITDFTMSRQK